MTPDEAQKNGSNFALNLQPDKKVQLEVKLDFDYLQPSDEYVQPKVKHDFDLNLQPDEYPVTYFNDILSRGASEMHIEDEDMVRSRELVRRLIIITCPMMAHILP